MVDIHVLAHGFSDRISVRAWDYVHARPSAKSCRGDRFYMRSFHSNITCDLYHAVGYFKVFVVVYFLFHLFRFGIFLFFFFNKFYSDNFLSFMWSIYIILRAFANILPLTTFHCCIHIRTCIIIIIIIIIQVLQLYTRPCIKWHIMCVRFYYGLSKGEYLIFRWIKYNYNFSNNTPQRAYSCTPMVVTTQRFYLKKNVCMYVWERTTGQHWTFQTPG